MPVFGPRQARSTVYGERAFRFDVKAHSYSIAKVEKACWIFENYARVQSTVFFWMYLLVDRDDGSLQTNTGSLRVLVTMTGVPIKLIIDPQAVVCIF